MVRAAIWWRGSDHIEVAVTMGRGPATLREQNSCKLRKNFEQAESGLSIRKR